MTEFKNLTMEIAREDRDVSGCAFGALKHWVIDITNTDTDNIDSFDYYGGSAVTLDDNNLFEVLRCLLDDALVIIEGDNSTYYDDGIDYLISELGYEYKDAKKVYKGCKEVYAQLSSLIDDLDNKAYSLINELNELDS